MVSPEGACAAYYNFGRLHRDALSTMLFDSSGVNKDAARREDRDAIANTVTRSRTP
jgi:hypothetical protein